MNCRRLSLTILTLLSLFVRLRADTGNDNANGVAGGEPGEITTGGLYSAYTMNAKRIVTDCVVSGSVGAPLAFTRYNNSRSVLPSAFGNAAGWSHSYSWLIPATVSATNKPVYTVYFPDGRSVIFDKDDGAGATWRKGKKGIRERLEAVWDTALTNGNVYVHLPDGGRVWFQAIGEEYQTDAGATKKQFTYTLRGIYTPYNQLTTINYDSASKVTTVTEPAGRWIKIFLNDNHYVDHITASDGRTVEYRYKRVTYSGTGQAASIHTSWDQLMSVTYFGDSTLKATYDYRRSNTSAYGCPLVKNCHDIMFAGPMKTISYDYVEYGDGGSGIRGHLDSERHSAGGANVSTINVLGNGQRREDTGDGRSRQLTYNASLLQNYTDFRGKTIVTHPNDTTGLVDYVKDRNLNRTDFTNDPLTGNVQATTFPATPNDAPAGRGVIRTAWVAPCSGTNADPNNCDANQPYWQYSTTDEAGNTTYYFRDSNHRIRHVLYPDAATEDFDYNTFAEIITHRLRTGGLEKFEYDSRGLLTAYRDPYHLDVADSQNPSVPTNSTPTTRYKYDSLDRRISETDALGTSVGDPNHSSDYTYNSRGQVLTVTHPTDPVDGQRHGTSTVYNDDGTVQSVTDELGHTTSYTYDDYRRVRSVTTPGHNTPLTTQTFYDANGTGDNYTHTDSAITFAVVPGGERTKTIYDANRRKQSVTVAAGTSDAATTSYGYDDEGNVISTKSPNEQSGQQYAGKAATATYDERKRLATATDALNHTTTFRYDAGGRKASVTRPNGSLTQQTTFDSYDSMNRLLQQTVKQTPTADAVTKWTYYPSSLVATMQDPRLVALNSAEKYSYTYDLSGRKTRLDYPKADVNSSSTSELWRYDTVGRMDQFTNRAGKHQSFSFGQIGGQPASGAYQRVASWDDNGTTPTVTTTSDAEMRVTSIVNANAAITRSYFNDNLLNTETTTYSDNTLRTVSYTYDSNSRRATLQYPNNAYSFTYGYTRRNQLSSVSNTSGGAAIASCLYDVEGNLTTRTLENLTSSSFGPYDTVRPPHPHLAFS